MILCVKSSMKNRGDFVELMISRNVRNYRESNSLSINKMAQNIISCTRNNIRLEAVYNIARSLNISIDDLLFKNIFKN